VILLIVLLEEALEARRLPGHFLVPLVVLLDRHIICQAVEVAL
jgi:hypothetical protein